MPALLKNTHKNRGALAEQEACDFLQKQGLTFLARNYHCPFGEIDLIMREGEDIVFIEVRLRSSTLYGDALESIHKNKQQKLLKSATHFLQKQHWLDKVNYRFDAIGFTNSTIDWIKDAFSYE